MSSFEEINSTGRWASSKAGPVGRRVAVSVDNAAGPSDVAAMKGVLHPQPPAVDGAGEPIHEDRFDFRLDDSGHLRFAIYCGDWFKGASYHAQWHELHIGVGVGDHGWVVLEIRLAVEEP
jgi:hypothetical protein